MMRSGSWWQRLCLVGLACMCSWTSLAHATPAEDEAARRHFESGRAYFERAEYDDAVREYEKSYALSLRPPLLVNISRAHESAGRPREAAEALERWLQVSPPDDPMRADIESRHKRLRAQADKLAEQTAEPAEAPVQAQPEQPVAAPVDAHAKASNLGPWLLVGGGGAALAGGVVVLLLGRSDIASVEDAKEGARWSSVKDKADSGPRKVMIGSVLGGVGVAALTAGLVWMLVGHDDASERQTQVAVSPNGVSLSGRF